MGYASDRLTRYRLRFLLQEFDLARGVTLIGRSVECHVTIEDALVSRRHARIVIDEDTCTVEDLASRNGVHLNNQPLRGKAVLHDGDRLRIGTQSMVFCHIEPEAHGLTRTTGVLRICANCRRPYPREMLACPVCEETEQIDDTLSSGALADRQAWVLQLLIEALEKSLALGRGEDSERLLERATRQFSEMIRAADSVTRSQVEALAILVLRWALTHNEPRWGEWLLDAYGQLVQPPSAQVLNGVLTLLRRFPQPMGRALAQLVRRLEEAAMREATPESSTGLDRLRTLSAQWSPDPTSH